MSIPNAKNQREICANIPSISDFRFFLNNAKPLFYSSISLILTPDPIIIGQLDNDAKMAMFGYHATFDYRRADAELTCRIIGVKSGISGFEDLFSYHHFWGSFWPLVET